MIISADSGTGTHEGSRVSVRTGAHSNVSIDGSHKFSLEIPDAV